jgi:transcriptional regulator with XRE-family HTH domain
MFTALRLARLKTGITLRSFARLHRLDEATLSRVERGIQYVPPHRRLRWPSHWNSAWTTSATRAAGRSWLSKHLRWDWQLRPL